MSATTHATQLLTISKTMCLIRDVVCFCFSAARSLLLHQQGEKCDDTAGGAQPLRRQSASAQQRICTDSLSVAFALPLMLTAVLLLLPVSQATRRCCQ
jgi:hypothetical protein